MADEAQNKNERPAGDSEASRLTSLLYAVKWPRGKYNGQRIEGFMVSFSVRLLAWRWVPLFRWNFGQPLAMWLCFTVRFYAEYENRQ